MRLNKIKYYKISKIDYSKDNVADHLSFSQIMHIPEIIFLFVCLFVLFHLLFNWSGEHLIEETSMTGYEA